ncbi:MAG: HNH endonuclease family protein [Hyphomonadaceae bacterium]
MSPERARRFFQALDRFTFACELAVIDNRQQEPRYARAVAAVREAGSSPDEKLLYGAKGALELTESEHMKFIATLNRSRKRDRSRRLLLIRLEAAMPGGHLLTMKDDVTVEHILPKANTPWWNERFLDPVRRVDSANLIGNQTLVTHDQNKRADAKPYPDKRKIFFNTPGAPIHALTKDIANVDDWNPDVIEARQERLVRLLCEDWGLLDANGAGSRAA